MRPTALILLLLLLMQSVEAQERFVDVPRGACLHVVVTPRGIDRRVEVRGPDGTLTSLDVPERHVSEGLSVRPRRGGRYRILVTPAERVRTDVPADIRASVQSSCSTLEAEAWMREAALLRKAPTRADRVKGLRLAERAAAAYQRDGLQRSTALLLQASLRYGLGDRHAALSLAREALAMRRRLLGRRAPATLDAQASVLIHSRPVGIVSEADARALHRDVVDVLGPDHPDAADALVGIAHALEYGGQETTLLDVAREALAAADRAFQPDAPQRCAFLDRLARQLLARRQLPEAEALLRQSLALRRDPLERALTQSWLAKLLILSGRVAEGERLYREVLAMRQRLAPGAPDTADAMIGLAHAYSDMGRPEDGAALLRRALAVYRAWYGARHPEVAFALVELGTVALDAGNSGEALRRYGDALSIYEKAYGPEHPEVADLLGRLGFLNSEVGNFKTAQAQLKRSLAIREKALGPDHLAVADALDSLGLLCHARHEYADAERYQRRALAIREQRLPPDDAKVGESLNNLALVLISLERLDEAEALLRRDLAIAEKRDGPESRRVATLHNNLAALHARRGDFAAEDREMRLCLAIEEKILGPHHPQLANVLENLTMMALRRGDAAEALRLGERSASLRDRRLADVLTAGSEEDKRAFLEGVLGFTHATVSLHAVTAPRDPQALRLALRTILRRKGRALDAMASSLEVLRRRLDPADRALLDRYAAVRGKLAVAQATELEAEAARLEDEISRRSARFRGMSRPVTIEDVQARIPEGAALVEYFRLHSLIDGRFQDEVYVAYVLRREGPPSWVPLGPAAPIDDAVAALRRSFSRVRSTDWRERSRALHRLVFAPLRPLLGAASQVLISPDDRLNLVPFGALLDEHGAFLLQYTAISYLTVGADLLRLPVEPAPIADAGLVLAAPSFGDRGAFAPLPGALEEARMLHAIFPHLRVLTGTAATEGALKRASGPRMLHLATHGFYRAGDQNPLLRSGVALAGANARRDGAGGDGILTALEAASLNLEGTRLVTLSACETGVGDTIAGDGVHGLRRALVLAGSESQLMSLWKVSDDATRDLMELWYSRLRAGDEPGEALRRVQIMLLQDPQRSHPFFWAPFILSGDWRAPGQPPWRFETAAWWTGRPRDVGWVATPVDARGRIALGSAEGVRVGDRVRGGGTVANVSAHEAVLRGASPGWIEVECHVGPALEHSALWPLTLAGASIRGTFDRTVLVDYRRVAGADTPETLEGIVAKMLDDIHEAAPFADQVAGTKPLQEGRFAGKTVREAMEATTRRDVLAFLMYAGVNPQTYARQQWKLGEIYATWALQGAPDS